MLPNYRPTRATVAFLIREASAGTYHTDTGFDQAATDALLAVVSQAPQPSQDAIAAVWSAAEHLIN